MLEVKELKCKYFIVEKYFRVNIMLIRLFIRINSILVFFLFLRIRGKNNLVVEW